MYFWSIIYYHLRPLIKWFLHRFTRLCELQRICYGMPAGALRAKSVEESLSLSKNKRIREIISVLDMNVQHCSNDRDFGCLMSRAVTTIMSAKKIKSRLHPDFPKLLYESVDNIWRYKLNFYTIEKLRTTQYDSEDLDHETELLHLWKLLSDTALQSRTTKQWQDIGFQGDDPKTDFRGMGLLGLLNLVYFAREYNSAARHVLLHSLHPTHGYTFAIVGINLTSFAYELYKNGIAKTHFYNLKMKNNFDSFHKFYCYIFFEFDKFWMESKPKSMMEFSDIREKFLKNIIDSLKDDSKIFRLNLTVENI